jgi:hypothetical protein
MAGKLAIEDKYFFFQSKSASHTLLIKMQIGTTFMEVN